MGAHGSYYVPKPSHWPLIACIGLFTTLVGAASCFHVEWYGPYVFFTGFAILIYMMFGWFGQVVYENNRGKYDLQVDHSFRLGMMWFIFSEVCFFGAFFSALFYSRFWSIPILGGVYHPITHTTLWPYFTAKWPLLINPDNDIFMGAFEPMGAAGIALINTMLLLTSSITITWAHWALKLNKRKQVLLGTFLTIVLALIFLACQAIEYHEAYTEMNLSLSSGMYGSTFFMLTGFHGLHVSIGTTILIVILYRLYRGHFTAERHFGFEAAAWYWHFVDVVWLFLYVFVYWL
ncbi:MAG: cytochrome c oxidase subunit 3 [Gammaproteobacteria bacterium]|nr:cytochrome c oxidase subunit 3 [Gammaproteobacteria bacterium]